MPTLTPIYASSGDGTVRGGSNTSWAAAIALATGATVNNGGTSIWAAYASNNAGDANTYYLIRAFLAFDLTGIPAGATITDASLNLYGLAGGGSSAGGSLCVTAASQASTTTLATSDFGNVTPSEYATRIPFSAWNTTAYNGIAFNATGIAALQAAIGGTVKMSVRSSFDVDGSAPANTQWSGALCYATEQSGTANDPYLTVTYTIGSGVPLQRRPIFRGLYIR